MKDALVKVGEATFLEILKPTSPVAKFIVARASNTSR